MWLVAALLENVAVNITFRGAAVVLTVSDLDLGLMSSTHLKSKTHISHRITVFLRGSSMAAIHEVWLEESNIIF